MSHSSNNNSKLNYACNNEENSSKFDNEKNFVRSAAVFSVCKMNENRSIKSAKVFQLLSLKQFLFKLCPFKRQDIVESFSHLMFVFCKSKFKIIEDSTYKFILKFTTLQSRKNDLKMFNSNLECKEVLFNMNRENIVFF